MPHPHNDWTLDLAVEMQERLGTNSVGSLEGVRQHQEQRTGMTITTIEVLDERGAARLGKPIGSYITIEAPGLRNLDTPLEQEVSALLTEALHHLMQRLKLTPEAKVFVVGLGNRQVTPDALGPRVVDELVVTRHLFETMPDQVSPGFREVSALAPDVYGNTGVETSDIIQSIIQYTRPDLLICVDALASRALERVTTTIQLTDTGIHPGSGVGNHRKGLTREQLGIPVIAIGVPTVVYASTIIATSIDHVIQSMQQGARRGAGTFHAWTDLPESQRHALVQNMLDTNNLIVTPKQIDGTIANMANLLATSLNAALHQAIAQADASSYTHH
jgi:spore protease